MNHVVLTLFIDHVHPIWTIEVLGGLLMTFWQSVAACSLLFVFASQSWQFLSQNKWLANNFKVEACWSAHIITITSLCIYLLVRPIFLFAERRGVPPWILGSFWMLLTLSLSMSFQKVYFFVCLFDAAAPGRYWYSDAGIVLASGPWHAGFTWSCASNPYGCGGDAWHQLQHLEILIASLGLIPLYIELQYVYYINIIWYY